MAGYEKLLVGREVKELYLSITSEDGELNISTVTSLILKISFANLATSFG